MKQKVDRLIELRREIARLEKEQKALEEDLKTLALADPTNHEELKDPEREGRQYIVRGTDYALPVIITADLIVGEFKDASQIHKRIEAITGEVRPFFKIARTWKNQHKNSGKKFRSAVREALGKDAERFISAAVARDKHNQPISRITIDYDHAETL